MTVSNLNAVVLVDNLEPPLKWDSTSGKVKLDALVTPIGEYTSRDAAQAAGVKPGSQYFQTMTSITKLGTLAETSPANANRFGQSVAVNGNGTLIAVGAIRGDAGGLDQGCVYIYSVDSAGLPTLLYSFGSPGGAVGGQFGRTLAMSADGTRLAVGEVYSGTTVTNAGRVHLYTLGATSATLTSSLMSPTPIANAGFYRAALSGDGNTLVVGDNTLNNSQGVVYVFNTTNMSAPTLLGGIWGDAQPAAGFVGFGGGVALNYTGTELVVRGDRNVYDVISITSKSPLTFTRKHKAPSQIYTLPGTMEATVNPPTFIAMSGSGNVLAYGHNLQSYMFSVSLRTGDSVVPTQVADYVEAGNTSSSAGFGTACVLSADSSLLLIGAPGDSTGGMGRGKVYLYRLSVTRALRVMDDMPVTSSPVVEAGGFVANTGGTVTLDNITVTSTGAGNAFTLKTVSGTLSYDISGWCTYGANADAQFASSRGALTMTTAAAHPFGWAASGYKGNSYELTILDRTNGKVYQITGMVGDATNNAFIKIKRIN